jgi:hypothetical protein
MTVADLIGNALQRINVVQAGESPSPDDQADAFARLNQLMGKWRLRRLTIPYTLRTTWNLTSTKGTLASPYTVGTAGDINILRPPQPNQLVVRYQDTTVSPTLELPLTKLDDEAWEKIPQKNLTSTLPTCYYYNPTYASGFGSLYLWMVPTQASLQGVIYSPAGVANFSAVSDTITLPDGYDTFIQDSLSVDLWPMFREGQQIDPVLIQSARDSEDAIKTANLRMVDLTLDPAFTSGGYYDIQSDGY